MDKFWLSIIFFVSVLFLFSGCEFITGKAVASCKDSDGGKVYSTYGYVDYMTVSGSSQGSGDNCVNSKSLVEYYCEGNKKKAQRYVCKSSEVCANGACVSSVTTSNYTAPVSQEKCIDSDANATNGGKNYIVSGKVDYTTFDGQLQGSGDNCIGNTLVEYYCDGNAKKSVMYDCMAGYGGKTSAIACSQGACVPSFLTKESCTDQDGGLNYNVSAFVNYITADGQSQGSGDFCTTEFMLNEYYCDTGKKTFKSVDCSSLVPLHEASGLSSEGKPVSAVCSNNACVKTCLKVLAGTQGSTGHPCLSTEVCSQDGLCVPLKQSQVGEACGGSSGVCVIGSTCTNGVCVKKDVCMGDPCKSNNQCAEGFWCDGFICKSVGKVGEKCESSGVFGSAVAPCMSGLVCDQPNPTESGVCKSMVVGLNEACGNETVGGKIVNYGTCIEGTWCDTPLGQNKGTCKESSGLSESCYYGSPKAGPLCMKGTWCDQPKWDQPGVCKSLGKVGDSCKYTYDSTGTKYGGTCIDGAWCDYKYYTSSGVCKTRVPIGGTCKSNECVEFAWCDQPNYTQPGVCKAKGKYQCV